MHDNRTPYRGQPNALGCALIMALCAAVWLTVLFITVKAFGDDVTRTRTYTPVACHPVYCAQERTTTTSTHGQGTQVWVQRHRRPAESRTPGRPAPWGQWHTVQAYFIPAGR